MKRLLMVMAALLAFRALYAETAAPDAAWYRNAKGLLDKKDYTGSVLAFEKALYLNPYNYNSFYFQGRAYLGLNDKDSALADYYMAYDLNPSPAMKKVVDDLYERTHGMGAFTFYPLTFEAFLLYNVPFSLGSSASSAFNFNFGFGAFATYHFNTWLAAKSGLMLVNSSGGFYSPESMWPASFQAAYLDIPAAVKFKFRLPWSSDTVMNGFSLGGYLGIKASGKFESYDPVVNGASVPGADMGLYFNLDTYYLFGAFALVSNQIVEYSLVETYPGSGVHVLNLIVTLGAAF